MKHKKASSVHARKRSFPDVRGNDLADANEQELQKEGSLDTNDPTQAESFKRSKISSNSNDKKEKQSLPIQSQSALCEPSTKALRHLQASDQEKPQEDPFDQEYDDTDSIEISPSAKKSSGGALRAVSVISLLLSLGILSAALCLGNLSDRDNTSEPSVDADAITQDTDTQPSDDKDVALLTPSEKSSVLSAAQLYRQSIDAVVSVITEGSTSSGIGSGFLISENGYVATAAHVIKNMPDLTVQLSDGRRFSATRIAANDLTDLAVLKIDAEALPYLSFGRSQKLSTGDRVYAIGTPASLDYAGSLSSGEISFQNRSVRIPNENGDALAKTMTLIQMNAPVNPGNSGCPLFNEYGQVIGIVTMKLANQFDGIGFAIPSDGAVPILQAMVNGEELTDELLCVVSEPAARLGILGQTESANGHTGVRIVDFESDPTPSAAAVLKKGDLIVQVDSFSVHSSHDVQQAMQNKKAGQTVRVTVVRAKQTLCFDVILEKYH